MTCDNCKNETPKKLIYGAYGWRCDACAHSEPRSRFSPNLHVKGVNKHDKNMTYAMQQHIRTRHIGKDGRVHAHPRWETKDF